MKVVVTKTLEGTKAEFIEMIAARVKTEAEFASGNKGTAKDRSAAARVVAALEEVMNDLEAWVEVADSGTSSNGVDPMVTVTSPGGDTGLALVSSAVGRDRDGAGG